MSQQGYSIEGEHAGSAEPNTMETFNGEIDFTCPWCGGMLHDKAFDCPVLNAPESEPLPEEGEQQTTGGYTNDVAAQSAGFAQDELQFDANMFSRFTDSGDLQASVHNPQPMQVYGAPPQGDGAESAHTAEEEEAAAQHSSHTRIAVEASASATIEETHEDASPNFVTSEHASTRADGQQLAPSLASSALNSLLKQGNDLNNAKTALGEHHERVSYQIAPSAAGSSSSPKAEGILNFQPRTDTVPQGFADPSAAKDWLEQIQAKLVKPIIEGDDYEDFEDTDIMDKANEFYQAILQAPEGTLLKWEPYVKRYYVNNQLNSTTIINDMLAKNLSHRKLFANCIMAAKELHKVHSHGVPQLHIDQAGKSSKHRKADGYSTDLTLTCSQRFVEAIEKVRWNKSIAKRLAEGDYLYLVRDPKACYTRELNNIECNARKAFEKANKASQTSKANTDSTIEDEEEEDAVDEPEETAVAPAKAVKTGAKSHGKKRRAPSNKTTKDIAQNHVATQPTAPVMQPAVPTLPAPASNPAMATGQQTAKRKRPEGDSGDDEIVRAQRRAQLGRLNYELKRHREEEAARARAAAPAGLIDPEITSNPFHGHRAGHTVMQQPMQHPPQNGGLRQQPKRKDSGTAIDFGTESIAAQQHNAEHVGRHQQYMGARRDALSGPSAPDQNTVPTLVPGLHQNNPIDLTGPSNPNPSLQTSRQMAPPTGYHYYPYGQPVQYSQPPQPTQPGSMDVFPPTSFNAATAPPYYVYHNQHQQHVQDHSYLSATQPFANYTSMQQNQRTRRQSESRRHQQSRNQEREDRQ